MFSQVIFKRFQLLQKVRLFRIQRNGFELKKFISIYIQLIKLTGRKSVILHLCAVVSSCDLCKEGLVFKSRKPLLQQYLCIGKNWSGTGNAVISILCQYFCTSLIVFVGCEVKSMKYGTPPFLQSDEGVQTNKQSVFMLCQNLYSLSHLTM